VYVNALADIVYDITEHCMRVDVIGAICNVTQFIIGNNTHYFTSMNISEIILQFNRQVAQLRQRDRAKLALFSINIQLHLHGAFSLTAVVHTQRQKWLGN